MASSGNGALPLLISGDTALAAEQFDRAATRYGQAITQFQSARFAWGLSDAQAGLGGTRFCQGDVGQAAALYAESLDGAQKQHFTHLIASSLLGLAGIAATMDRPRAGARLIGATESLAAFLRAPIFPRDQPVYDRCLAAVRSALGEDQLMAALGIGRDLSLPQAIVEAQTVAELALCHTR